MTDMTVIFQKFHKETTFLGRNGEFKSIGVKISFYDEILIQPTNSKGRDASCYICIPQEDVENFIRHVALCANIPIRIGDSYNNSVEWSIEDFLSLNENHDDVEINEEEAENALSEMMRKHDCNNGINWDTVNYYYHEYAHAKE